MGSNAGHNQANQMLQQDRTLATPFYQDSLNEYRRANAQGGELFDQLRNGYAKFANGEMGYNANPNPAPAPAQEAPSKNAAPEFYDGSAKISTPPPSRTNTGDQTFGAAKPNATGFVANDPKTPSVPGQGQKQDSFNISMPGYKQFATTGGYDDATRAGINSNIGVLSGMGQNGGLDTEAMNRMRGGGYYDELARTGGIDPKQAALMRAQGNSSIGSTFQGMRNDIQRQNLATGGLGFGATPAQLATARAGSRSMAEQGVNTSLGILNAQNAGKLQGAQGMVGAENSLQAMRTGNMMKGAEGAAGQQMQLQNAINEGMKWGLTQQQATKRAQEQAAEQAAARSAAAQAQAADDAFRQYQYNTQLQMQGLNALGGLRGQSPAAAGMYGGLTGNSLGQLSGTSNTMAQSNPYQNPWSTVAQIGGMIGGGIGAINK